MTDKRKNYYQTSHSASALSFWRQVDALQRLDAVELRLAIVLEHQPLCHEVAVHLEGVDQFDALAFHVNGVGGVGDVGDQAYNLDIASISLPHGLLHLLIVVADDV